MKATKMKTEIEVSVLAWLTSLHAFLYAAQGGCDGLFLKI